jgi:hypothetical protein
MANEKPYLTITLTGRPPVKIKKDDWPVIADATDNDDHGTQIGNQANREDDWRVKVRQHADGRAIVYAIYDYSTLFQGERGASVRGGELVAADGDLVETISRVSRDMAERVNAERVNAENLPGDVFLRLGQECIADLPAVEI